MSRSFSDAQAEHAWPELWIALEKEPASGGAGRHADVTAADDVADAAAVSARSRCSGWQVSSASNQRRLGATWRYSYADAAPEVIVARGDGVWPAQRRAEERRPRYAGQRVDGLGTRQQRHIV